MLNTGVVSIYDFDLNAAIASFRFLKFEAYDHDWLHFIVNNWSGGDDWRLWDIVEGGIANYRVIDTVENYMVGLIDEDSALGLLALHQPNHQLCILNQQVIERYLHFIESYQVKAYVE